MHTTPSFGHRVLYLCSSAHLNQGPRNALASFPCRYSQQPVNILGIRLQQVSICTETHKVEGSHHAQVAQGREGTHIHLPKLTSSSVHKESLSAS